MSRLLVLLAIISVLGLFTTSFLIYHHYFGSEICKISKRFSCDAFNKSKYSVVFGVPLAVLGLIYFIFTGVSSFLAKINRKILLYLLYASIPVIIYSAYLTFIELAVLNAVCIFCELTKALIILVIVIVFVELRKKEML